MVVTTYYGDIHGQEEQIVRRPKLVWFLSIFLMHESTFADPLYGVLQLTEGFYQLEPVILTHPGPLKNFTQLASSNRWVFELHTLEPAFDTERFQCVRSIDHDGCLSYIHKERQFVRVDYFKHPTGDSLGDSVQGATNGQPQLSQTLTTEAGRSALSAGTAAAATSVLGSVALPALAFSAFVHPEQTKSALTGIHQWVEFDHQAFRMRLINAYSMLGLTTLQDVRQYADRMGNLLVTMRNHVQQYQQQAQNLIDQYQLDVHPWLLPNEHLVSIVPAVITMPDQLHLNDVGIPEPSSNLGRVDANISQSIAALKIRIEQEKRVVMRHYVEREWQTFHAARTAGDFENFLIQYRSTDQAGLVPQANSILNQLLKPQVPLAPMPVASSTSVAEKIQLVQQPAIKAPSVTLTQTTRPTDSIQK